MYDRATGGAGRHTFASLVRSRYAASFRERTVAFHERSAAFRERSKVSESLSHKALQAFCSCHSTLSLERVWYLTAAATRRVGQVGGRCPPGRESVTKDKGPDSGLHTRRVSHHWLVGADVVEPDVSRGYRGRSALPSVLVYVDVPTMREEGFISPRWMRHIGRAPVRTVRMHQ
jgi:hypothetical protein